MSLNARPVRNTIRHDYGKLDSEGLGNERDSPLVMEGAVSGEPAGSRKKSVNEETIELLEREFADLKREDEELKQQAQISKLQKKIKEKRNLSQEPKVRTFR